MKNNDAILIQRVLAGDDTAFSILVRRYQKPVHALAWRKIGDFHVAEEITQDTFLKAYQRLATLKEPQRFASWLYVIAARCCIAWLRKKRLRTQSLEKTNSALLEKATYSGYVIEENERIAVEARREIVKNLLAELQESERTVVTLHYFGEMSSAEIGAFLGVSANTVRSRLRRAQQRLKKEEPMIREALLNFQITPNLTPNLTREISRMKLTVPSGAKPFMPWAIAVSTVAVIFLMLGVGNQYFTRFQRPYSFNATSEMTIELIEAPVVLDLKSKPDIRTQLGKSTALDKSNTSGQQPNDTPVSQNSQAWNFSENAVAHFTLSNGIRVVNLHVENCEEVGIFTYLPLGLVDDGKAKALWSQLIMHLTVRTTGPIDYKTSNGEAIADSIRLEFQGNTDTWTQGLDLHAKWLSGLPFSAESLTEEIPRVLSQINYIEANLATHKLAFAAWNQVFRHGETDISMHRDVQSAQLHELQAYRDLHLTPADHVLICVIGGVDSETLKRIMDERLGSINLTTKMLPQKIASSAAVKDQNATWDVGVTHYMETYAIPHTENEDYSALYVASMLLRLACMQDAQLKELTGHIFCGVDLVTPEQTYLYVSASLKQDADIESVKQRIRELINPLKQPGNNMQVPMLVQSLSMELSAPPDIATVMQYKPANITETLMLLQIGVTWGTLEYQYGNTLSELASAFAKVSAADVAKVVNQYLTEDRRMTLLLTPCASE
jgi:RNA polymerase sigma factor (sigma-70 family)